MSSRKAFKQKHAAKKTLALLQQTRRSNEFKHNGERQTQETTVLNSATSELLCTQSLCCEWPLFTLHDWVAAGFYLFENKIKQ